MSLAVAVLRGLRGARATPPRRPLRAGGRHTDVVEALPGSMVTADLVADNPGTWLLHCHVADHIHAGMLATYAIR